MVKDDEVGISTFKMFSILLFPAFKVEIPTFCYFFVTFHFLMAILITASFVSPWSFAQIM